MVEELGFMGLYKVSRGREGEGAPEGVRRGRELGWGGRGTGFHGPVQGE